MNNFIFSLNATVPIFLVILVGWILMQKHMLTADFTSVADKFVFKIALPCLLFKDIATANIKETFNLKFVLFCMIVTTIMFLSIWFLTAVFMKDDTMKGAFIQASARGSSAVLGIAFVQNIYGNSGMAPMMIVASVPLYNIFSVIILTFNANDNTKDTNKIKTAFFNILKNPIIISIFVGLLFALLEVSIPTMFLKTVTSIASTATPLALLVVGATFEGKRAIQKIKPTMLATFIKLILLPTIFLPIAYLCGFRNGEMVAILVMLASPTTVTCYIMAKNMNNDALLSSSIVVTATIFSSVTLTMWVYLLRSFALI
ncbi:AEC family transporter [Anaerosporobacter sp.]|uniref:AEC family transporter n=1 Tax=Anaerosporobacter sp. TaxID=1872529 RepID=UPI00286F4FE2|nr:AEC family transporter [Anaerosporobacter sp.]